MIDFDHSLRVLHPITLVDAVTAAISGKMEIPVRTFDRHFTTMRARVWRS
jgi:hypothetical protein